MKISDAESIVMTALWRRGEATSEELVASLAAPNCWQEATIETLKADRDWAKSEVQDLKRDLKG